MEAGVGMVGLHAKGCQGLPAAPEEPGERHGAGSPAEPPEALLMPRCQPSGIGSSGLWKNTLAPL